MLSLKMNQPGSDVSDLTVIDIDLGNLLAFIRHSKGKLLSPSGSTRTTTSSG